MVCRLKYKDNDKRYTKIKKSKRKRKSASRIWQDPSIQVHIPPQASDKSQGPKWTSGDVNPFSITVESQRCKVLRKTSGSNITYSFVPKVIKKQETQDIDEGKTKQTLSRRGNSNNVFQKRIHGPSKRSIFYYWNRTCDTRPTIPALPPIITTAETKEASDVQWWRRKWWGWEVSALWSHTMKNHNTPHSCTP